MLARGKLVTQIEHESNHQKGQERTNQRCPHQAPFFVPRLFTLSDRDFRLLCRDYKKEKKSWKIQCDLRSEETCGLQKYSYIHDSSIYNFLNSECRSNSCSFHIMKQCMYFFKCNLSLPVLSNNNSLMLSLMTHPYTYVWFIAFLKHIIIILTLKFQFKNIAQSSFQIKIYF